MRDMTDRVRRLNSAVNAHDLNPIGDMYANGAELKWPGLPAMKGRQAVVEFYAQMFGAFPDLHVTLERIAEQDGVVAAEYEAGATNSGPLPMPGGQFLPPTQRRIAVHATSVGTVDHEGRIKVQHEYFDQLDVLTQLGILAVPTAR